MVRLSSVVMIRLSSVVMIILSSSRVVMISSILFIHHTAFICMYQIGCSTTQV